MTKIVFVRQFSFVSFSNAKSCSFVNFYAIRFRHEQVKNKNWIYWTNLAWIQCETGRYQDAETSVENCKEIDGQKMIIQHFREHSYGMMMLADVASRIAINRKKPQLGAWAQQLVGHCVQRLFKELETNEFEADAHLIFGLQQQLLRIQKAFNPTKLLDLVEAQIQVEEKFHKENVDAKMQKSC